MSLVIPMTRATGMGPLPDLLEARESTRAVQRAFSGAGLPMRLIADRDHLVPLQSLVKLFNEAARFAGDPLFGLNVGLAMRPQEYGLWMRYSMQAPTLADAIARLTRCLVLHQFGGRLRVEQRPGTKVAWQYWHLQMSDPASAHHADHVIPVMIQFARQYLGASWRPDQIEVAYPVTRRTALREEALGVPWLSGQDGVALVFSRAQLAARHPTAPTHLSGTGSVTSVEVLADHWRSQAEDPSACVEAIVALRLMDGKTDLNGTAELMGLGTRSLQRALSSSGQSYRALLDQVRMKRAVALIAETQHSLTHIAFEVGYSDLAHFTRAFTRYFGYPPSQMRTTV